MPPPSTEVGASRPIGPERLPVPLRPFTVADVIDGGITALKVAPLQLLAVTAPFVIPIQVLSALVLRADQGGDLNLRDSFAGGTQGAFSHGLAGGQVIVSLLASLALTFAGAAAARLICSWYIDRPVTPRAALGAVLRRSHAVVALWLLVHLAEAVSAFPFLITVVFAIPFFMAAAPILGVEGVGPWTTIRRCFGLTKRRYAFALCTALMVGLIDAVITGLAVAVAAVASALATVTSRGLDLGTGWVWALEVAIAAGAALVVVPFVAATSALVYLDLRVRNEGLDIELAAIEQFGDS